MLDGCKAEHCAEDRKIVAAFTEIVHTCPDISHPAAYSDLHRVIDNS
jgi:hypothetical protein